MNYIDNYKRWYCYRCKRYDGAPSPPPTGPPGPSGDTRSGVMKPKRPDRSTKRPHHGKRKPLKNYPKYRD